MIRILSMRTAAMLSFLFLISHVAFAQKTPQQVEENKKHILTDVKVKAVSFSQERQTPTLIELKENAGYPKDQAKAALTNYLQLRNGIDYLMPYQETKVDNSFEVTEFQQYYKGIKVEHARYKALVKNGVVQFFNGVWYDVPATLAITPAINEAQGLTNAKVKVGAKKYAWEDVKDKLTAETNISKKAILQKQLDEVQPKGELVIVKDFNKFGVAEPRLAYKYNIYATAPLSRAFIYVDARDGHTLLIDKIIKHVDNPGKHPAPASVNTTVKTRYSGNQIIKTKQIFGNDPNSGAPIVSSHPGSEPAYVPGSATYVLIDDTRGGGIETYDLNGVGGAPVSLPGVYTQAKSFTDVDNNWTLAEHHRSPGNDGAMEAENDDIAWDAHWGAEVVYDYWKAKHNRLSYDGKNTSIRSFIHYGPAYDNAFWNGSVMTYGDGSGPAAKGFRALTSLDVCGHEIGHGVCASTANLVYQGESGAMNEAFSDIWASCIENFSMVRTGSTVPAKAYRPFYIGEQIGSDSDFNHPLRRMDNTKQQSNPDTYGGTYWQNPNCTPTLANDQCGVHTNSGLLNKWFFLITAGSKTGTRPANLGMDPYYFADSDDGVNDKGNTYTVNGLGFDVSENITFITETMLPSTATYAEARDISIQVAKSVSGNPCSAMVETITNAWYAIGVGDQFVKPCAVKYGFIYQPGASVSEASTPSGCLSKKTIDIPVLLPANSTATLTVSGTASNPSDYTLSATSLTNATTAISKQSFVVTIINDAVTEGDETVVLKLALTNAGTNPVNSSYTLTIIDDDVTPVIGSGDKTLLSQTFTRADGFDELTGWTEILEVPETNGDPMATGKNQWGIFDNQLAITGKDGVANTKFPNGTYNNVSQSQTLVRTPLIDASGLSLVNMKFDYTVQGETDPGSVNPSKPDPEALPVFDYMAVAYSIDGTHFTELTSDGFKQFASPQPYTATFQANLPVFLANKKFYLAFRWSNDASAGGPVSVKIDNLLIKGSPRTIENDLGHSSKETLNAGQNVFFYSVQDGQVLGKIKNSSANNFGCTNVYVEKTGTGTFGLYTDQNGSHKVSEKIIRVVPTTDVVSNNNTVNLYYTEAQIKAVETATGKARTALSIFRIDAASYSQAVYTNTKYYPATYTSIPGVGGYFTIVFNDKIGGSYALGAAATATTSTLSSGTVMQEDGLAQWKFESVYPNPGKGNAYLTVTAPKQQRVKVDVVNTTGQIIHTQTVQLSNGSTQIVLPTAKLANGSYRIMLRDTEGNLLNTQQYIKR